MDKSKNGTNFYKAVCAVAFILFSLVYLYYYQTDILAAAQHIASGGRTHYEPVLGPYLSSWSLSCYRMEYKLLLD